MGTSISIRKGTSQQRDTELAAAELFAALDQPDTKLVVFYCAADQDLPALAKAIQARFGATNVIGCTTAGEITPQGYLAGSLTGVSLASPQLDVATQVIALAPFESVTAGHEVTALIKRLGHRNELPPSATDTFAFLLIDGLAMQEELVVASCVHQNLQGIEMVGGSAADDRTVRRHACLL